MECAGQFAAPMTDPNMHQAGPQCAGKTECG